MMDGRTRILITGVTGFAGGHLAESLLELGPQLPVWGTCRDGRWPSSLAHLENKINLLACDLCEAAQSQKIIAEVRPDRIYHLAGFAHTGRSLQEPEVAWAGNLTATLNLYRAVGLYASKARIVHVSSGLVYGDPQPGQQATDERTLLRPATPYACSKAAADLAAYQYARFPGLGIVRVRPFNHIGPRQSPDYAVANFARQIVAIERGRIAPVLRTGNLASRRDLTDVRDVVRAYHLLMENGRTGEAYNVGSGVAHTMNHVVERLCEQARVSIEVLPDQSLMRAAEEDIVRADATKIAQELGWQPRHQLDESLCDILDFWRAQF